MKYKMFCIFARESLVKMNGVRGKLASQAGHAYLHSYWDAMRESNLTGDFDRGQIEYIKSRQAIEYLRSDRAYKITLVVDTVPELVLLREAYKDTCGTALITDAGFTVFKEPTTTCLGIGPIAEEFIGDDLKALKTLT